MAMVGGLSCGKAVTVDVDGGGDASDAASRWTALDLPNGPPAVLAVVSENGSIHVLYIVVRQDPRRWETLHWIVGEPNASVVDVFETPWQQLIREESRCYSAIHGRPLTVESLAPDRVNMYSRTWSPHSPMALTELFTCQYNSQAIGILGGTEGASIWAQRTEATSCSRPIPPYRDIRCPGNGFGLFRAGDPEIKCPFSDTDLVDYARKHANYIAESAIHPTKRIASFNRIAFYSFNEDGGLVDYVLSAVAGAEHHDQVRYFRYLFWPTNDEPYRRVGVGFPGGEFEVLSWIDAGVVLTSSPIGTRLKALHSLVETTKGVVVHGEPTSDAGARAPGHLFLLLSRDGTEILAETEVVSSVRPLIFETTDGIYAYRAMSPAFDGGRGVTLSFTRLDFD